MTATVIRFAESDWRVFASIRLRALTDALGEQDPQYQKEAGFTAAQWRRRLRNHTHFATLVGGRPVGLIAAQRENPDSVYLYSLWLDPTVRGRGLARALVAATVDWARNEGVQTITLRVASGNVAARAVYESLGFRFIAASENATAQDEVAMTLSVS
ncbi:GNAT family N-acetyltransferase [Mycolicibacterium gadium]|uniref:GNAT family N-acetyltransferase n=1 Tax=Mycolicibacterium gadium TaxID=1794 RepID=A0ABT6GUP5_MYCGU|nr:GNAT family N-acetyltransferase [Mycolicibacterium gadium]MDG5484755.1 GNAT family N-acetyltransferase [Mycolicibacterium gadium]